MAQSHILGFPRIGPQRELKKAVEAYWANKIPREDLLATGMQIRKNNWLLQRDLGLGWVTVGDFSWYDQVLDHSVMFGVLPARFGQIKSEQNIDLDLMFNMARGGAATGGNALACEMTKWFDTNYHYIVPEFAAGQEFQLASDKLFAEVKEALGLKLKVKPVLLGPLSYLWLGKAKADFDKLTLLPKLLPVYLKVLTKLKSLGVKWVQIDEPILALDLPMAWSSSFEKAYHELHATKLKMLLTTYFGDISHNLTAIAELPVEGIHLDLVRSNTNQLIKIIDRLSAYKIISCGLVDGRNIWCHDLNKSIALLQQLETRIEFERLWIGSSCSLMHVPVDLEQETKLDDKLLAGMAFAKQKIQEISLLTTAINKNVGEIKEQLELNAKIISNRKKSRDLNNPKLRERIAKIKHDESITKRNNPYNVRSKSQQQALNLPLFPTTTIGSYPQTKEIRQLRRKYKNQQITKAEYTTGIEGEIKYVIQQQEQYGLDVLVHGEPERNDMVEYFGELLKGFAFTEHGWVQSYGSRCVKPPVIYGDVYREQPMTVDWINFAKSLTCKPLKGMLTGPVTILCWSFVRDDQPLQETALQIALALRDEICDLEANGVKVIQVDEPAFREGLPLLKKDQAKYLDWAVKAFQTAVCGVKDQTQIHTHMCYSEFNELIEYIAAMDADVISIESSRSDMELLQAFEQFEYPNEIGPGVYDIHSPQIPSTDDLVDLLSKACGKIPVDRIWVNPDCGLKTRKWPEVKDALTNMVEAAKIMRAKKEFTENEQDYA